MMHSPDDKNMTNRKNSDDSAAIEAQISAVGKMVTVSGWGLTRHQGSPSDVLREVNLPVLSNASCSSELQFGWLGSVICGDGPNGTSACNSDSGGPFAASLNGEFYSIGTVSWHWDFGDGHTSVQVDASHQYQALGVYNVILTVTDANGQTSSSAQLVKVQ